MASNSTSQPLKLLTFSAQVAAKIGKALGRKVEHVKLTQQQSAQRSLDAGLPEFWANFMAFLEAGTAGGMEERQNDVVERVGRRKPQTFDEWVVENKAAWQ